MEHTAEGLITELDKLLDMVRVLWIESRDDFERRKNGKRLDELLDERLRLMKLRDGTKSSVPTMVQSVKVTPKS